MSTTPECLAAGQWLLSSDHRECQGSIQLMRVHLGCNRALNPRRRDRNLYPLPYHSLLAQRTEHHATNVTRVGSTPTEGTITTTKRVAPLPRLIADSRFYLVHEGTKMKTTNCIWCGRNYTPTRWSARKYCTQICQSQHRKQKSVELWLSGQDEGWTGKTVQLKRFIRNYLKDTYGSACSRCGWDEYHPVDGRSLTEVDHIDGNAKNCSTENLRILCPNCHSMTDTHRARNKNSQRKR